MDLKEQKLQKKEDLKKRILTCRSKLIEIGVKKPLDKFASKYPKYNSDTKRLNNLWYGYVTDDEFTKKLEEFVEFKKVVY